MEKEIIILAKSEKRNNYCIAGVDTKTGNWIRPISNNKSIEGAVTPYDIKYKNGGEVQLLDVVRVPLISHNPTSAQPENHIYDSNKSWIKTDESSIDKVINFRGFDDCNYIFGNTYKSVTDNELPGCSLLLLYVNTPSILIEKNKYSHDLNKVTFEFSYKNLNYKWFGMSDIELMNQFSGLAYNTYRLADNGIAVFSLTGKYERDGKYYKMLAKLF